jgi:hypothetical protein
MTLLSLLRLLVVGRPDNAARSHCLALPVALQLIQQNISAVTAAHKPAYIAEDLDVFSFELTAAEMATLSAISPPSPAPPSNASCLTGATYRPGVNFENGKDLKGIPGTTPENCAAACCADVTCGHFVYTPFQPGGVYYGEKVRGMHTA